MSDFIGFYFYKNVVLGSCQVCFNFYNGFSSLEFFEPSLYYLYNILLTTLPSILIIINEGLNFDCTITDKISASEYLITKLSYKSQWKKFLLWLLNGCS